MQNNWKRELNKKIYVELECVESVSSMNMDKLPRPYGNMQNKKMKML